jgi:hypothetical protein
VRRNAAPISRLKPVDTGSHHSSTCPRR